MSATSRCGSAPCSAAWAAGWTGRGHSPTRTSGSASSKGPRRSRSRRRRPVRWWTCWPATRYRAAGPRRRSCSRWTSSAPCHGGCRSGICMSGPAHWAWPSRCPPSRGRAWPRTKTSATGWQRPPTAASGCCAPRSPSLPPRWRAAGPWWTRPGGCSAPRCSAPPRPDQRRSDQPRLDQHCSGQRCGATKGSPGSTGRRSSTPTSSAGSRWGRPRTSTAAA